MFARQTEFTNVLLRGGLGNQMFQYAAALSVALRTNTRLRLDLTVLDRDPKREFRLDRLAIDADLFTADQGEPLPFADPKALAETARVRFGAEAIVQRGDSYGDELSTAVANSLLVGYWQSEQYFVSAASEVRRHFQLKEPSSQLIELKESINNEPCVAIHVRRADYATDREVQRVIGLLDPAYFRAAAAKITELTGVDRFCIFSDDPKWCAEHLELPGDARLVSGSLCDVEELHLLASCDHAIISNSSFSWWAAWMGASTDGVVVAPSRWLRHLDSRDGRRIPEHWIALPAQFVELDVE